MIHFSTEDKLSPLKKWSALPFICNFSENECNKFNCWDLKLSNNVNTVHVAAIIRKLQQQEKVFEYLCTHPKRDLLPQWRQVGGGGAIGKGGLRFGGVLKKIWKCFQKCMTFQYLRPSVGCSNTFGGKCTWGAWTNFLRSFQANFLYFKSTNSKASKASS